MVFFKNSIVLSHKISGSQEVKGEDRAGLQTLNPLSIRIHQGKESRALGLLTKCCSHFSQFKNSKMLLSKKISKQLVYRNSQSFYSSDVLANFCFCGS